MDIHQDPAVLPDLLLAADQKLRKLVPCSAEYCDHIPDLKLPDIHHRLTDLRDPRRLDIKGTDHIQKFLLVLSSLVPSRPGCRLEFLPDLIVKIIYPGIRR